MVFPKGVVEELLVACHRYCCLCHKFCGSKIEIHHIIPESEGGPDTLDNAIALCFDCHAEVNSYSIKHPKGRKFTSSELMKHKQQWLELCSSVSAFHDKKKVVTVTVTEDDLQSFENIFDKITIVSSEITKQIIQLILIGGKEWKNQFFEFVLEKLKSDDDEMRWKAACIIEEYSNWNYHDISVDLLNHMAEDNFFGVRSVAVVIFFDISQKNPAFIPLDTVYRLAWDNDWYVHTPASATLESISRTNSAALDLILLIFKVGTDYLKDLTLNALEDIGNVNPETLLEEKLDLLISECRGRSKEVYQKLKEKIGNLPPERKQRYYAF